MKKKKILRVKDKKVLAKSSKAKKVAKKVIGKSKAVLKVKKKAPEKKLTKKIISKKAVEKVAKKVAPALAVKKSKTVAEKNLKKAVKAVKKVSAKEITKKDKPVLEAPKVLVPEALPKKITKTEPEFLAHNLFKAKIKVIGIGGGGSSIVSEISRSLDKATFVVADTDTRVLGKQKGVKYFLFGQEETRGLGTGLNPDLAILAAEKEKEKIAGLFAEQDIVILVASLGGGVGSGAAKVFAEASKNSGAITLGIFTLPFKFEGGQKHKIASKALKDLKELLNVSLTIPNERIFKVIDTNTPIVQAFSRVNRQLIEGLESLIDLIYNPGVINIDFADVKAILNGKGSEAFLNTAEASGKDRAEKVIEDILHNHLYQFHSFLPDKVLFNIVGGDNLSMFEVDKISKAISQKNPKAKIIFGISKNNQLKNKIKATLLMTGGAFEKEAEVKKEVEKPKKVKEKKAPAPLESETFVPVTFASQETVLDMPARQPEAPVFADIDRPDFRKPVAELESARSKKAIRRSALDIKKAQELEENKKTLQEEEWDIPAFLRIKK